jgi:5-methylcytosine-specific restriction endonuclease McrA
MQKIMLFWWIILPIFGLLIWLLINFLKWFFNWLKRCNEKVKTKRLTKQKQIVAEHSVLYQNVRELNSQTKYYTEILDDGCSKYIMQVNSLAKYKRATPEMALHEYLEHSEASVLRALEQVQRNQVIFEVYEKNYDALSSTATAEDAEKLGISFSKYLYLERIIAQEEKLDIIHDYSVICAVSYTSPAGVNSYVKDALFSKEEIVDVLNRMRREHAYFQSEEFRRKNERAKVTPSLRYDVMRRDGFRCCLCGRTASDGIELEVDHIVPISKGGSTIGSNLQTLCRDCNRGKSAKV